MKEIIEFNAQLLVALAEASLLKAHTDCLLLIKVNKIAENERAEGFILWG